MIAILVLHAGPTEVSLLAAAGLAVGALVAVPLGPWVEFRRKRPVMVAMDLTRFAALLSVPVAFALGWLSFAHLVIVAVIVGAADITFTAAIAALTALWGLLASVTTLRSAVAGLLILATPLLLPRHDHGRARAGPEPHMTHRNLPSIPAGRLRPSADAALFSPPVCRSAWSCGQPGGPATSLRR